MKKKVFGLDLVRVIALYLVILVHSFMHSNFNYQPLIGFQAFILLFIRNIAFVGVLLFIILTGYLKINKKIDKNHYKSIIHILLVYFIVSIITILFRKFVFHEEIPLKILILGIFNYSAAPYAWYVEMYIGLFLMIPFLNVLYHNIPTKKQKQFLLLTLFAVMSLFPTLSKVVIANQNINIFPDWWALSYPILLYFIGAYLREYQIHINKLILLPITILYIYIHTIILFFYAQGSTIMNLQIPENSSLSIILACLIFLLLYDVKTHSKFNYNIISFCSKASFGAYLISYCFDKMFYSLIPLFSTHMKYYYSLCTLIIPLIVFACSIISSYIINLVIDLGKKIVNLIKSNSKKNLFEA